MEDTITSRQVDVFYEVSMEIKILQDDQKSITQKWISILTFLDIT